MPKVLVIDNDDDVAEIVREVLAEAGFEVTILRDVRPEAVRTTVGQLEPDCVLLDGEGSYGYGSSWDQAGWLSRRGRPVPVLMFTAGQAAPDEVGAARSARSRAFAGVVPKPFDTDELVGIVTRCISGS